MSNVSCSSFSSINAMLTQANEGDLNVTTTVASCPEICSLAWGTGNPDLSGIGANCSYILQAVLTVLCGPILSFVYERSAWNLSKRTNKHLSTLQNNFLDISAQFSIPVAIAAVIRLRQHASFYELDFLHSLLTMQFLSLLSTSVISGLFKKPDRRGPQRCMIIILYGIVGFGFYTGYTRGLIKSGASWDTINELRNACIAYGQIFPWTKHIPPPAKLHVPNITINSNNGLLKNFFGTARQQRRTLYGAIIFLLIIAGALALVIAGFILVYSFAFLAKVLTGDDHRWFAVLMSLGFSVGTIVELVAMERTREVMKGITQAEFEDNQWGFGQVIALFLWVPLCTQIAYYVMCFELAAVQEENPDAEQGRQENIAAPSDKKPPQASTEISKDRPHDSGKNADVQKNELPVAQAPDIPRMEDERHDISSADDEEVDLKEDLTPGQTAVTGLLKDSSESQAGKSIIGDFEEVDCGQVNVVQLHN